MSIQNLKGFRDFLPQDARKRQFAIEKLSQVFERYGFEPLETPALEYEELLAGKYGEEGDKLMYRFTDHGGRRVAMKYDQTVPLARIIAQYKNDLPLPFKRYQIQNVWRAENTQKGRYREFLQCDADIIGVNSAVADATLIALATDGLKSLGFQNFKVIINDRKIFSQLIERNLIEEKDVSSVVQTLDKLKKIGKEGVIVELEKKGFEKNAADIVHLIENTKVTEYILKIQSILENLNQDPKHFSFEPTLARGLDYYTDLIFEVEIEDFNTSVCGGGRYNNLIKNLAGIDTPAAGFAYGFDRIIEAMEQLDLFPKDISQSSTKVLVTIFDNTQLPYSLNIVSALWNKGINAQIYEDENARLDKQFKYADRKKIPYAVIAGPDEVQTNTIQLKNMGTGEQKKVTLNSLPDEIK